MKKRRPTRVPARPSALHRLAEAMGVATQFRDGLGNAVRVGPDTLVRVCRSMGAELTEARDAAAALGAIQAHRAPVPPVLVAWDGRLDLSSVGDDAGELKLRLDGGGDLDAAAPVAGAAAPALPLGVHELTLDLPSGPARSTVIAAPTHAWRPPSATRPQWGVAVHLAALRSARSRSVGDLADLRTLARAVAPIGADAVTVLPILPTFNDSPAEPSPYSPVSRLFWSELALDLGASTSSAGMTDTLDVARADAEVRAGLGHVEPPPAAGDTELRRYAAFRGAQRRLGRDWRAWPAEARTGPLSPEHIDAAEERFHLVAQLEARRQMMGLVDELAGLGLTLGLDLAVGVHPLGYDVWSRRQLFADEMAVGAPPDAGFPSGQNWGFPPVLPAASAAEGHDYLRASIAHQASVAGLLRVDHIMAMRRLYWIPQGMELHEGTYVSYPLEEMFALLCLESHRHQCEIVGENLGTVPPEIEDALRTHRIHGMHLAQFAAGGRAPVALAGPDEVASIGTHDTPTFAGWLAGTDIDERVELGLLPVEAAPAARSDRAGAAEHLAAELGGTTDDPVELLELVIVALGASQSPMVLLWLEDLWLEPEPVNIPGTSSAERPNWQRPMHRALDDVMVDPQVTRLLAALDAARRRQQSPV